MIAYGREPRNLKKEINYNERNLWEKSIKESPSDEGSRRKKNSRSTNNIKKKQANRSKASKASSRSNNRSANRRSNSSRSSKVQKQKTNKNDYDSQSEEDYYDNDNNSDSDSNKEESDDESTNSDYDSDSNTENEGYDYEESEDDSKLSMSHRKIKPVKFFEIPDRKKSKKSKKKVSKSKSKGKSSNKKSKNKSNKSNKKSSNKNKKRNNNYSSDEESGYNDESESDYDQEEEEEEIVQTILGIRDPEDEGSLKSTQKDESGTTTTDDESPETKYYVKFVECSYQQCKWLTKDQLFTFKGGEKAWHQFNKHVRPQDISELTPSLSIPNLLVTDETSINSDWYEIDRIINDANEHNHKLYQVKWKSLDYTDSTWELEENIKDKNKIKEYEKRLQHSNPKKFNTKYKRPTPDKFEEIKVAPESKINTKLRDYQLAGLNWLRNCWYHRKNNILADEMGLGKTAQVVCLLNDLYQNEGLPGPFLVIAPVTTLAHWKTEFERWTDLNCVVFHGDKRNRKDIIDFEINFYDDVGVLLKNRVAFDVLVTNPEMLRSNENRLISSIQWRYLIFDEAHRMKNSKSTTFNQLKHLDFDHCTLLTGTPIQNNVNEMWSLLNFIDPKHYNDLNAFQEKFSNMRNHAQVQEIQNIIKPILLRRKKGDVEKDIKPKDETIIEVELTRIQKQFYKAFLNENAAQLLAKMTSNKNLPSLKNLMMQLRKVCNHPFLIVGAEKSINDDMKKKPENVNLSKREIRLKSLIDSSGKMILIDKLLPKLKAENHKVLIFSQMVKILDLLENYLNYKGYKYERLDGGVQENERQQSIERFNRGQDLFVFLLSTKAGGVGINLTTADTVIIYDPDWNPQNDIQAEARCHRIGQTSVVKVYRLITKNTYESELFARASKKLALDHVILDGGNVSDQQMNASEIEKILRHGAYTMFNDSKDDDAEIDKFVEADIDQILSSRTRRVQEDVVAGGGSVFSTVTYKSTNDDLDINAPDFWSRVLPLGGLGNDNQFQGQRKRNEMYRINPGKVRNMIQVIVNQGYPPSLSPNDNEVAHACLQIAYSLSKPRKNRNVEIILYYLRGQRYLKNRNLNEDDDNDDDESNSEDSEQENFDLDDPMKVYGDQVVYVVEEKAEKIIRRVIYFYRLRECLYRSQGNGYKWPEVKPLWDSPLKEYALMLGVYRYGLVDMSQIVDDQSLGLEHSKLLKKQQMETRIDSIVSKIESQFVAMLKSNDNSNNNDKSNEARDGNDSDNDDDDDDDYPLFEIPDKFEPMEPSEWAKRHAEFFSKNLLTDKEVNAIIQVVLEFGIPVSYHPNSSTENENENETDNEVDNDEKYIDALRIIQLASPSLEKVAPEVVKSFIGKLLFVINRIGGDDENEDESDNENENNDNENPRNSSKISSSRSMEIDLSDFPELQKLSATRIKNLKQSISVMSSVYGFIISIQNHPDKKECCTTVKTNSQFPEWWTSECDVSMIDSFAKYGQNFVFSMLADQSYPFYSHLNDSQKEVVDSSALQEQSSRKQMSYNEDTFPELKALFSRRSRVPRVLSFINHINKRYERKMKVKRHHHSHSKSGEVESRSGEVKSHVKSTESKRKSKSSAPREMPFGDTVEKVVYNLRNPQKNLRLEKPADYYLNSRKLYSMKNPNAFGLDILVNKRNIRIVSFGVHRPEKQFNTRSNNCSFNPGFVSFRKYPVLASSVYDQRWYICEIIDLNDKPFFRITDIDSPQFTFTDDDIVKLFIQFFMYLRRICLPKYKAKMENHENDVKDLSEDEIRLVYDSLDDKEQKVAPYSVSSFKCYTIFGLNEKIEDNNDDENNENNNADNDTNNNTNANVPVPVPGSSSTVDRNNANLASGLMDFNIDLPLYDIDLFPKLKNYYDNISTNNNE
ncbi:choline dehydrogenase 6 [Tritrichomonas musculus]|uniref:Choline dehydrogenase 6 n=1 Tax=Tritrichomonas musculus TaxID=1915356 RepID=A0ABR2L8K0_9EUKA